MTAAVQRRVAREIIMVNRNRKKARGLVTDVQYGAVLSPGIELRDGDVRHYILTPRDLGLDCAEPDPAFFAPAATATTS